jgi:hypothetical protein
MKRRAVALALLCACGGGGSRGGPAEDPTVEHLPPWCAELGLPPPTLECTGLYRDVVAKELAPGVEAYAPAVPLWSDGTEKERWIRLPPGTTVDNSDPSEWVFPDGTKLWKQFARDGRRIETRLWQKVHTGFWIDATYAWNDDESAAVRSRGGDIPLGSGTYHIPTQDECEKCHRGRTEHILGFEQVELGLPGASGVTLERLATDGRLSAPPASTALLIGDDGTGAAAPALGWLHANCGITCHNSNSNSIGNAAGMVLRLDPTELDGRPVSGSGPLRTTVGVTVNTPDWHDRTRIVAGDPATSLLYQLISNRGMGNQMPPFASDQVDVEHVALVEAWIRRMPPAPVAVDAAPAPADAAVADAEITGPDATDEDASPPADAEPPPPAVDASAPDPVPPVDAGPPDPVDAGAPEPVDAGAPDPVDAGAPDPVDAGVPDPVPTADGGAPEPGDDAGAPGPADGGAPDQ